MLQVIAKFNRNMFDKPWLWAVPCTVELIIEVVDLRRTLLIQLNSSNPQLAPSVPAQTHTSALASAYALASAHASATAQLPAHATVSVLDKPSVSPFWGTCLA